jgi:hypothetical protein
MLLSKLSAQLLSDAQAAKAAQAAHGIFTNLNEYLLWSRDHSVFAVFSYAFFYSVL